MNTEQLDTMESLPELPASLQRAIFGLLPRNDKACLKLLCKATRAAYAEHNSVHPGDGLLPLWLLQSMWCSTSLNEDQQEVLFVNLAACQDQAACIVNLAWLRAQHPPCAWGVGAGRAAAKAGNLQVRGISVGSRSAHQRHKLEDA